MGKEKEDQLEEKKEIKYHRRLNDVANAHLVMLLLPSLAYLSWPRHCCHVKRWHQHPADRSPK